MQDDSIPEELEALYASERERPLPSNARVNALWQCVSAQIGGGAGGAGGSSEGGAGGSGPTLGGGQALRAAGEVGGASSTSAISALASTLSNAQLIGALGAALAVGGVAGYQVGVKTAQGTQASKSNREATQKTSSILEPQALEPQTPEPRTPEPQTSEPQKNADLPTNNDGDDLSHHTEERAKSERNTRKTNANEGSSSPSVSRVREERRILDVARNSLDRKILSRARDALVEHEQLFEAGLLREEREAMMIHLLRLEGRDEAADERLDAFEARYPKSPFLHQLTR